MFALPSSTHPATRVVTYIINNSTCEIVNESAHGAFRSVLTSERSMLADVQVQGNVASSPLIATGDMVVFFEGREAIGFDRMKSKAIWQCRHGAFHHDDMLGKPFGSRVRIEWEILTPSEKGV